MKSGQTPPTAKEELTSVQKSWGSDQDEWKKLREESIGKAQAMFADETKSWEDIFNFLANERIAIAKKLTPGNTSFIDSVAFIRDKPENLQMLAQTPLASFGTYSSYYDYLLSAFFMLETPDLSVVERNPDYDVIKKNIKSKNLPSNQAISTATIRTVIHDGLAYSTFWHTANYVVENRYSPPRSTMLILHTPAENIPAIKIKITELFLKIQKQEDPLEKIRLMKEMMWHFSHAMLRARGSAAIGEMFMEAFLRHLKIKYDLSSNAVLLDLVALFSATPKDFAEHYTISPDLEPAKAKKKPREDFVWEQVRKNAAFYTDTDWDIMINEQYEINKIIRKFLQNPVELLKILASIVDKRTFNKFIEIIKKDTELFKSIRDSAMQTSDYHAYCCYALITSRPDELDKDKLATAVNLLREQQEPSIAPLIPSLEGMRDMLVYRRAPTLKAVVTEEGKKEVIHLNLSSGEFIGMDIEKKSFIDINIFSTGANFTDANFNETVLKDIKLADAMFVNAKFEKAILQYVDFSRSNLTRTTFNNAELVKVYFTECKLNFAEFNHAKFKEANMKNAELEHAKLNHAQLKLADLSFANLEYAELHHAKMDGSLLEHAKLNHAKLHSASLKDTTFISAELKYAQLNHADLSDADMSDAILEYTDFQDAILINTDFSRATLTGAKFKNAKFLSDPEDIDSILHELKKYDGMTLNDEQSREILRKAVLGDVLKRVTDVTYLEEIAKHPYFTRKADSIKTYSQTPGSFFARDPIAKIDDKINTLRASQPSKK